MKESGAETASDAIEKLVLATGNNRYLWRVGIGWYWGGGLYFQLPEEGKANPVDCFFN